MDGMIDAALEDVALILAILVSGAGFLVTASRDRAEAKGSARRAKEAGS
jgi:predicted nucleic acid-binding Zn ribbon protein